MAIKQCENICLSIGLVDETHGDGNDGCKKHA